MILFKNDYKDFNIFGVEKAKSNAQNEVYVLCPQCTPHRKVIHQKEKKLAVNIVKGTWYCQHCGYTGGLSPLRTKFEQDPGLIRIPLLPLYETVIEYWEKRKISLSTLNKCEVKCRVVNIRDKSSGEIQTKRAMAFLFRHNGILRMIKYRDAKKNFSIEKGSKLIPWGLDSIVNKDICIIVEGEPDRLSFVEAGYDSVVSVPAGTQISPREKEHFVKTGKLVIESHLNLSYFDSCYEYFADKKIIYIGTDTDAAGIKLRMEISRRFGYEKCKVLDFSVYKYINNKGEEVSCKDANEVLVHYGVKSLEEVINNAEGIIIADIVTVNDVWNDLTYQYHHGLEKGKSTMYPSLDAHFTWKIGHPVLVNGYPNMGKTSFVLNLIMLTAINYGWKWGIYTPENYPEVDVFTLLFEMYLGNTLDKDKDNRATMKELEAAKGFINKHFKLVNNEKGYTPQELRDIARSMIQSHGITGFVKDPWNSLNHKMKDGENLDSYLEKELSAEVRFAINNQIINVVCVHPPTPKGEDKKNTEMPSIFEIRGGLIWSAKFYEIIGIHQSKIIRNEGDVNFQTEIDIQKVKKHKLVGIPTRGVFINMHFQRRTNRYVQLDGYNPYLNKIVKENIIEFEESNEEEDFAVF
jgi:twinkle protein